MLKIVLVGLTAVFLVLAAGSVHREYAFLIGLCGAVLIFSYGLGRIRIIADYVREFERAAGLTDEYVAILLKMVGIAYLSQFAVSLCRDAGQGAIAGQIGFAGKLSMLIVSLPVLEALIRTIGELL